MTDKVTCLTCEKTMLANLTKSCHNCDDRYCALCVMREASDVQECSCEWLCETCRQGPQGCKGCDSKGCYLCMNTPCEVCQERGQSDTLLCDDCLRKCYVCKKDCCLTHVQRHKITRSKGDKLGSVIRTVCWKCIEEALSAHVESKNKSAKRVRSETEETPIVEKNEESAKRARTETEIPTQ